MPTWPTPEGRRSITVELPELLVKHLDSQADYLGCSRAAYIRQLIVRDTERQGPTRLAAQV
jgi:metal-responsive CopG/Arc/MetJ family transcriptional regulator